MKIGMYRFKTNQSDITKEELSHDEPKGFRDDSSRQGHSLGLARKMISRACFRMP